MTRIPRARVMRPGIYLHKKNMCLVEIGRNKDTGFFWIADLPHCRGSDIITHVEFKKMGLHGPITIK